MNRNLIASELLKASKEMTATVKLYKEITILQNHLEEVNEIFTKLMSNSNQDDVVSQFGENGKSATADIKKVWKSVVKVIQDVKDIKSKARNSPLRKASQVAKTIAEQMGGVRRLKMMLGGTVSAISNGLAIKWPNRKRTKGNYVEITLKGNDTYTMEFFNLSGYKKKTVKKYTGIYFDQLVEIFEKQTGWYLRI